MVGSRSPGLSVLLYSTMTQLMDLLWCHFISYLSLTIYHGSWFKSDVSHLQARCCKNRTASGMWNRTAKWPLGHNKRISLIKSDAHQLQQQEKKCQYVAVKLVLIWIFPLFHPQRLLMQLLFRYNRKTRRKKKTCLSTLWKTDIGGNGVNWNKGCGAGGRDVLLMWFFPEIWSPPSDHSAFDYLMPQVFRCSTDATTLRVARRCVTTRFRATRCTAVGNDFAEVAVVIGRTFCNSALSPAEPSSRVLRFFPKPDFCRQLLV